MRNTPWIATFAVISLATLMTCSYLDGRVAEQRRIDREVAGQIATLQAENEELQRRFDLLADSGGEVAILEAGIRWQEQKEYVK